MKFGLLKAITATLFGLSLIVTAPAFAGQNRHGSHGGNSHHYRHGGGHGHHQAGHIIGGIIGGVILGSVIHGVASNHRSRHTYTTTYRNYYSNPRYYNPGVIIESTPTTTYRVLNGNECYLVNINQAGNEILTQVPNLNCGF